MSEYTADELRKEADLTFTERVESMLRAGADAKDRVKELESVLWKIHNSAHCHALLKIEAAAALQVKP